MVRTGIPGLDEITGGGLPQGRLTVVTGESGSGKTIFGLQVLASGAEQDEPGLFVSFEETKDEIAEAASGFGWSVVDLKSSTDLDQRERPVVFFDANPTPDLMQAGEFDLNGLLVILSAAVERIKATRIVFDNIDVLLDLLDDPRARRREAIRLRNWVRAQGLTALVTAKPFDEERNGAYVFLGYLASSLIALNRLRLGRTVMRTLEVRKLRGGAHSTGRHPILIDANGMSVDDIWTGLDTVVFTPDKVSSGVSRLDTMLDGGFFRSSSILVSGAPGTAKTSLGAAFVDAACRRGERALFLSFDEMAGQLERNLGSLGFPLGAYRERGLLSLAAYRLGWRGPAEQRARLMALVNAHQPQVVVIDPVSSLTGAFGAELATTLAERIIDELKAKGVTVLMTSLLEGPIVTEESTRAQISAIADTWIHLSFGVRAGERNRALTIIKSRGMGHSNQVRELVLSSHGLDLSEVYTASGEVLMGTARLIRERQDAAAERLRRFDLEATKRALDASEAILHRKLEEAGAELRAVEERRRLLVAEEAARSSEEAETRTQVETLRRADKLPLPSD